MTPVLVKINVDLYAPGSILSPQAYQWLSKWDNFHTRRSLFPPEPLDTFLDLSGQEPVVTTDFCHIRLSSIDDQYNGLLDSNLDAVLSGMRLEDLLGEELPRLAGLAVMKSPSYKLNRTYAAWLELWEVNEDPPSIKPICEVKFPHLVECLQNERAPR